MEEEIFGPILPVLPVSNFKEAIEFINSGAKPLASYLFSNNKSIQDEFITSTSSGNMCINHTMLQGVNPSLPFGGVGVSGIGAYHGKASFDTFTHRKSVLKKPIFFDPTFLYPPYTKFKFNLLKRLL
jgi:aldehyde dehydrogenase (NAD+)